MLTMNNIKLLLKEFPNFKKCLELCLEQNLEEIWNQICIDYHFNQDCYMYERIRNYYKTKDKNQKQNIKKLIKK